MSRFGHTRRQLRWAAPLALASLALAACGGGSPSSSVTTSRPSGPTYEVTTAKVGNLGTILVDGKGYTLYLFVPDGTFWPVDVLRPLRSAVATAHPSERRKCGGRRKGSEPPAPRPGHQAGGSRQVTYHGWPLYLWPNDTQPGQATGQGINNLGGLWYVVSPSGNPVR